MPKVLVIGASVTGGGFYHYLSSMMPTFQKDSCTFWEKSNIAGFGGRMCKASYGSSFCDMGAQYITKSGSADLDSVYSSLVNSGTFQKMEITIDGMKPEHAIKTHYMSPKGLSSIVEHLLSDIDTKSQILFDTTLDELNILPSGQIMACGSRRRYSQPSNDMSINNNSTTEQLKEIFDIVVLTIPTPSINQIKGNYVASLTNGMNKIQPPLSTPLFLAFHQQLEQVKYSSRYALAVFYPINTDTQSTLAALGSSSTIDGDNSQWGARYVFDNDVIRYVSFEGRKSQQMKQNDDCNHSETTTMPILIHTSVPFGIEHATTSPTRVEEIIMDNLYLVLPTLKNIPTMRPVYTQLLFWKESQVSKGLNWKDGQGSAIFPTTATTTTTIASDSSSNNNSNNNNNICDNTNINVLETVTTPIATGDTSATDAGIVFAGDYFTESNFEGCLRSAHSAAVSVSQLLLPGANKKE